MGVAIKSVSSLGKSKPSPTREPVATNIIDSSFLTSCISLRIFLCSFLEFVYSGDIGNGIYSLSITSTFLPASVACLANT